jgi:cell division protein FtsZ
MAEVNRVGELLRRECEGAELLLGAAVDPSFGNRLSLTFIGTRKSRTRTAGVSAETPVEAEADQAEPDAEDPNVETDFFRREPPPRRPKSRLSVPPPELSLEQREQLLQRNRRARPRLRQTMLPLEVVSKGRFEKSEPTVYRGEDLDVPTFVRRGVVLN